MLTNLYTPRGLGNPYKLSLSIGVMSFLYALKTVMHPGVKAAISFYYEKHLLKFFCQGTPNWPSVGVSLTFAPLT